jgi:hypothetical protein
MLAVNAILPLLTVPSLYTFNGHGGNVEPKNRPLSDYWVSGLEVFGTNLSQREISERESLWQDRLQSRETGLNRN